MGFGYIHSTEYEAWGRLNRVEISPTELQVLKSIDRANVALQNKPDEPPPSEPGSLFKQLAELAPDKVQKKAK